MQEYLLEYGWTIYLGFSAGLLCDKLWKAFVIVLPTIFILEELSNLVGVK